MTESSTVKYADLRPVEDSIESLKVRAYVACTRRRPALVEPFLKGHPHTLYYGPDNIYPSPDVVLPPHWAQLEPCKVGQYRAWFNQVEMAKLFLDSGDPVGLFMEDDAVPIVSDWSNVCNACLPQMENYDVLDLYADPMHHDGTGAIFTYRRAHIIRRRSLMEVAPCMGRFIHVWGCQAYYMSRKVALRLIHREYDGQPIDSYLPNFGRFAFLQPSPFKHDRSQGSMIENRLLTDVGKRKNRLTNVSQRGIL